MSFVASPVSPGDQMAPVSSVAGESMTAESRVSIAEWEVLNLQRLFSVFDPERTGYLLFDEVLDLLKATGITGMTLNQLRKYDHILDPLAQGVVEFPDLVEFYIHEHRELSKYRSLSHEDEKSHINNFDTTRFMANSKPRIAWDFVILVISVYYAIRIFYEWYSCEGFVTAGIVAEVILTILLLLDVGVQANTMYYDEQGRLVEDLETIVTGYAKSWMIPDLLGAIPFDLFILAAYPDDYCTTIGYLVMRTFRMLRLLRVFLSIFENAGVPGLMTPSYIYFVYRVTPAIKALVFLILLFHMLTVGWLQVSSSSGGNPISGYDNRPGHTVSYTDALYYTVYTLSTVGYGDVKVETQEQRIYTIFLNFCALMFNGLVISQISVFLTQADIDKFRKERMSETLAVLKYFGVNRTLQSEILSFQAYLLEHNLSNEHRDLYSGLPGPMQEKVVLAMRLKLINLVPVFNDCLPDVKLALANSLVNSVFCPQQYIIVAGEVGTQMFFLGHGVADVIAPDGKFLATLRKGMFFGEMAIFVESALRTASIKALTYCDVFSLRREDFVSLLSKFRSLRESIEGQMKERIRDYRKKSSVNVIVKPRSERPGGKKKVVLQRRNSFLTSLMYGDSLANFGSAGSNLNTNNNQQQNNENNNNDVEITNKKQKANEPFGSGIDNSEMITSGTLNNTAVGGGGGALPTDADIDNFNKTFAMQDSLAKKRKAQLRAAALAARLGAKASSSPSSPPNPPSLQSTNANATVGSPTPPALQFEGSVMINHEDSSTDEGNSSNEDENPGSNNMELSQDLATTQDVWNLPIRQNTSKKKNKQQQQGLFPPASSSSNNISDASPGELYHQAHRVPLPPALLPGNLNYNNNNRAASESTATSAQGRQESDLLSLNTAPGMATSSGHPSPNVNSNIGSRISSALHGAASRARQNTRNNNNNNVVPSEITSKDDEDDDDFQEASPLSSVSVGAHRRNIMNNNNLVTSPADFGYSGSHFFAPSTSFSAFGAGGGGGGGVGTSGLDALSSHHHNNRGSPTTTSTQHQQQQSAKTGSTMMNIADAVRLLRAQKLQQQREKEEQEALAAAVARQQQQQQERRHSQTSSKNSSVTSRNNNIANSTTTEGTQTKKGDSAKKNEKDENDDEEDEESKGPEKPTHKRTATGLPQKEM